VLATCLTDYMRTLLKVTVINGPIVERKHELTDGSEAWIVQFTAVAGNPTEFGPTEPLLTGFPNVANPWFGGVAPSGAYADPSGYIYTEEPCASAIYSPVFDPACPQIVPPPLPPSLPLGCGNLPVNWLRRQVGIPRSLIPGWGDVAPIFELHAPNAAVRNLRIRFYPDTGGGVTDPCNFCGDMVVSYVPQGATMTIDTAAQSIYVSSAGGSRRRADSLVFSTDGTPFVWPTLTCGTAFVMAIDMEQTQIPPSIDFSLVNRYA
jgi:hypothetical protein